MTSPFVVVNAFVFAMCQLYKQDIRLRMSEQIKVADNVWLKTSVEWLDEWLDVPINTHLKWINDWTSHYQLSKWLLHCFLIYDIKFADSDYR